MAFIVFTLILFTLTLKFEVLNNLIILFFILIYCKRVRFTSLSLISLAVFLIVLFPFFTYYLNVEYIKYTIYVFRFLVVLSLSRILFSETNISNFLKKGLDAVFIFHVAAIVLCYLFPPLNEIFRRLFSYAMGSSFRISGFIQGYEFVPYVVLVYLAYSFETEQRKIGLKFVLNLLLSGFVILLSGRFGLIPFGIFLGYVALVRFDIRRLYVLISLITLTICLLPLFTERIENISNTINLIVDAASGIDNVDLNSYNNIQVDGQYNLSPLTFYYEFIRPFENLFYYSVPRGQDYVDSGPSFLALNFGIVLSSILYLFYFLNIGVVSGFKVPWIITIIVLLVDFKFRSLYTLFPLIWLMANHYNFVIVNKAK